MSNLQNLTDLIQFNKGSVSIIASKAANGKSKTAVEIVSKLFPDDEVLHISLEDNFKPVADRYISYRPDRIRFGKQYLCHTMNLVNNQGESIVHVRFPDSKDLDDIEYTIKSFIQLRDVKVIVIDSLNLIDNLDYLGNIERLSKLIKDNGLVGIFTKQLSRDCPTVYVTNIDNYIIVDKTDFSFKVVKGTYNHEHSSPFSDYLQDENEKLKSENDKLKEDIKTMKMIINNLD